MPRRIAPHEPDLDIGEHPPSGSEADLRDRAHIEDLEFDSLHIPELSLRDANVVSCRFVALVSQEAEATGADLHDTLVVRPEITVLRAPRGRWTDVVYEGGRLGVLEAYDSTWSRVAFRQTKLSYVNLRSTEVTDLTLAGCHIEELDVSDATLRRVSLRDCRIETLMVRGAKLESVDLRGGAYSQISGVSDLRGAIVESGLLIELAPLLAATIGILVED